MLLLALYFAAATLQLPLLHDPAPVLYGAGSLAAVIAAALLVADVLLPLPSSIVMVANGALFGLVTGALISLVGRAGAFLFGYWVGAKALPFARRFVPDAELAAARSLLGPNGWLAIVVSRPVPILSETVAIMAGLSSLPLRQSLIAALAGSVPEALVLAAAGQYAATLNTPLHVFVGLMLVTAAAWAVWHKKPA